MADPKGEAQTRIVTDDEGNEMFIVPAGRSYPLGYFEDAGDSPDNYSEEQLDELAEIMQRRFGGKEDVAPNSQTGV